MSTLFQRNRLTVFEQATKNSVHGTQSMKDQFNGNTGKRRPPLHLIGYEVYEMVKDVHVVLSKQKRTSKNTGEKDMWKKQSIFLGVVVLERLRRSSFD
jgi:hypothetical protein